MKLIKSLNRIVKPYRMGFYDLEKLFEIQGIIKELDTTAKFNFILDADTKEGRTRIAINEAGIWHKAQTLTEHEAQKLRLNGFRLFVPDLVDFKKKRIIEYQEESKGRTGILRRHGKLNKKGHDLFSDEDKDLFYNLAGFNQLKLWESDKNPRQTLKNWLNCE